MNQWKRGLTLPVMAVLVVISLLAESTTAAESGTALSSSKHGASLEEIVVTARRVDESLQETPVSVSAFTSSQMEEAGIRSIVDLQSHVPGLEFNQNSTKDQRIFIRGMGQRTDAALFDPSVGVYLNGVLIPKHDAALIETVDIENVQVLRGPQGTLFGKNNTGGAILFESRQVNLQESDLGVSGRIGNYGRRDGKISGNLPLVEDVLGMRFSFNVTKLDGYMENRNDDGGTFGDENRLSGAIRSLWVVSENATVDLFLFASRTDELGLGNSCVLQNPDAAFVSMIFPREPLYDQACAQSQSVAKDGDVWMDRKQSQFSIDTKIASLTLDWQLDDAFNIKSITAFSYWDNINRSDDIDGSPSAAVPGGTNAIRAVYEQSGFGSPHEDRSNLSQELHFSGEILDGHLDYQFGFFASVEKINDTTTGQLVGERGYGAISPSAAALIFEGQGLPVPGLISGALATGGDAFVVPFTRWIGTTSDLENTTGAVFGELNYRPTDWFEMAIGGRYTAERRERVMTLTDVDTAEFGLRIGAAYIPEGDVYTPISRLQYDALADDPRMLPITNARQVEGSKVFKQFTPSGSIRFLATDEWLDRLNLDSFMTYLTVSKGFKAGGFDAKGNELIEVDPEIVTNYEIGFKIDAVESRLRLNGSIFRCNWEDMQLIVNELGESYTGSNILLFFDNAGKAVTQGVELEMTSLLGNWLFNANFSYMDAYYEEFDGTAVTPFVGEFTVDRSDEPLYNVPEYSGSISAQYNMTTPIGVIIPRLSFTYRDKVFNGLDYRGIEYDSSFADEIKIFNARLMYMPTEKLRLALYVNNLTDENYYASGYTNTDALGAAVYTLGPPRMYGLELNWEY